MKVDSCAVASSLIPGLALNSVRQLNPYFLVLSIDILVEICYELLYCCDQKEEDASCPGNSQEVLISLLRC